jgi:hypothetical protein
MAALNFPASPSLNDTYSNGTQTWIWNGTMWKTGGQIGPTGPQGPAGSAGNDLPKITAVTYTDATYTSNSATSVPNGGGYVKLTGSNFQSGICLCPIGMELIRGSWAAHRESSHGLIGILGDGSLQGSAFGSKLRNQCRFGSRASDGMEFYPPIG